MDAPNVTDTSLIKRAISDAVEMRPGLGEEGITYGWVSESDKYAVTTLEITRSEVQEDMLGITLYAPVALIPETTEIVPGGTVDVPNKVEVDQLADNYVEKRSSGEDPTKAAELGDVLRAFNETLTRVVQEIDRVDADTMDEPEVVTIVGGGGPRIDSNLTVQLSTSIGLSPITAEV